jgi:hypothetical protein
MARRISNSNKGRLLFTALLGVSIIAVIQMAGRAQLDRPLLFSRYCFAVAVPFLASFVWIVDLISDSEKLFEAWYYNFVGIVGSSASLLGIGATFWHFSRIVGIVFIVCSAFGSWVIIASAKQLLPISK